jgi:RimJ/RimL family protein N-acetyltransferase
MFEYFIFIMAIIMLAPLDKRFLKTIKDYKKIHLVPKEGVFYTILKDGKKAGVIGFKIKEGGKHFLKIGIHQDFRGQGIFEKALRMLAAKHKIKRIYSTVAIANLTSVKAHIKIGFKRISIKEEALLKQKGLLLKRNMRLVMKF